MDKKIKNLYIALILLLTLGSCFLFYRTRLAQIINPEDYIRSCSDYGQFFIELKNYSKGGKMTDLMNVSSEPGFYLFASSFFQITNIPIKSILTISSMIMYCLTCLIISVLATRIFQRKKNRYYIGFISVLLYISFYGNINSQIAGVWRQIFSQISILCIILVGFYGNYKKIWLIGGIFVGMALISHTFSMITTFGVFALLILYRLLFIKNKTKGINMYTLMLSVGIIFTIFYLYYVFWGYKDYAIYIFGNVTGLDIKINEGFIGSTSYYTQFKGEKSTGFNFFGGTMNTSPIYFYYLNYSPLILILISSLSNLNKSINNNLYKVYFLIIILYIALKIDFSTRALITLEAIILPLALLSLDKKSGKILMSCQIIMIFLWGFLSVGKGIINENYTTNVSQDTSIQFIKEHFSNKKNVLFLGSNYCTIDLLSGIEINTALNYHLKLNSTGGPKTENQVDFARAAHVSYNNFNFLERDPVVHTLFKDKDIYMVITVRDRDILKKIADKKYNLLQKPYAEIIYTNTDKKSIIKYIIQIKKEYIQYTDSRDYIYKNLNIIK